MAIGSGPGKMPPIMLFGFKPLAGSGLQFDKLEGTLLILGDGDRN